MRKQKPRPGGPPAPGESTAHKPARNPSRDKEIDDLLRKHEERKDNQDYVRRRKEQSAE